MSAANKSMLYENSTESEMPKYITILVKEETGEIVRFVCYNQESAAQVDCIIYGNVCDSGMFDLIYKLYKFNQMVINDGVPKGEYIEITPEMLNK